MILDTGHIFLVHMLLYLPFKSFCPFGTLVLFSIRVFGVKMTLRRSGYRFSSLHTELDPQRTRAELISSYRTEMPRYLPPTAPSGIKSNLSDACGELTLCFVFFSALLSERSSGRSGVGRSAFRRGRDLLPALSTDGPHS